MLRNELKKRCLEACEDEFDNIFAKYGATFTEDEPFEKVEQEEIDEAKGAMQIVENNWAWVKNDMALGKDTQEISNGLRNTQDQIINAMCELAQCYAVIDRYVLSNMHIRKDMT